ncbi:MAG: diguanylate cyclase [Candidatus Omnitrophota bacterium]|jgi:diguanylate cyclase (GGDEF)-like protein/PAS domain S-box-containing protein
MEDKDRKVEDLIAELNMLRQVVAEFRSRQAEESLGIHGIEAYKAIYDSANDAIFVHDIETGRILDVNTKACEMYCYPREEFLKLDIQAISLGEHSYTQEEGLRRIRKAAKDEPQIFEWLCKDKADRLFWAEVNLKRAIIAGKYRMLAILRDIDERKRTEERLGKINKTMLGFTADPAKNITSLTALLGKLLGADCALYNHLEGEMLSTCGMWNVPKDFTPIDKAAGHICYDVIKSNKNEVTVMQDLPNTAYADTDPNIKKYNLKTYIGHPVGFEGVVVGSICAAYQYDYTPSEEDKKIIGIIASAIGVEEERKRSFDETMERDYQLEILSRTSQHINATLEIPVILRTLIAAAMELVDATGGAAGLVENQKMVFREYNREGTVKPVQYSFERGHGVYDLIIESKKPYISNDAGSDPKILPEKKKAFDIYNIINVPILDPKQELIGCLEVYNRKGLKPFDTGDVYVLQGLAASAATALGNARMIAELKCAEEEKSRLNKELLSMNKRLKQLAMKDVETGLYNHHYLAEIIEAEFYRARRYGHPLSVVMIDIDYFKSVNDVYGVEFGDLVLRQFADYLKKMVRKYDTVIRFGGEEFVIVSPGVDKPKAVILAQRLLDAIGLYNFGNKKHAIKIKVSISVASYPNGNIMKGMDLINSCEKILDKVKEGGGNKVYSPIDLNKDKASAMEEAIEPTDVRFLKEKIEKLTRRSKQNLIESIFAFAKTLEMKDHYTGEHVENTVKYSTQIAEALDLAAEDVDNIRQASILHDLGKVGISDKILHKKSKLTKKEFENIKKHPQIAADIIRPIQFMHDIIPLVLYHHERWDGKGYPAGLKGEEIPVGARIIAVADVYQALTSNRPYRKAFSKKKALGLIKDGSGTQFDPLIVKIFLKVLVKEKKGK